MYPYGKYQKSAPNGATKAKKSAPNAFRRRSAPILDLNFGAERVWAPAGTNLDLNFGEKRLQIHSVLSINQSVRQPYTIPLNPTLTLPCVPPYMPALHMTSSQQTWSHTNEIGR